METNQQVKERRAHAYDLPPKDHPHYADAVAHRIIRERTRARREWLVANETPHAITCPPERCNCGGAA